MPVSLTMSRTYGPGVSEPRESARTSFNSMHSRINAQHAAVLHGLNRVGAQVHRDLMQIGRIADHRGIARFDPAAPDGSAAGSDASSSSSVSSTTD